MGGGKSFLPHLFCMMLYNTKDGKTKIDTKNEKQKASIFGARYIVCIHTYMHIYFN